MPYKDPEKRKAYQKAYYPKHYAANREAYFSRAKAHDAKMHAERNEHISSYLSSHPCVDCGEADIVVLEFDHREHSEKSFTIGAHGSIQISMKRLKAEIAKCDVRCANCHRRKTYKERGSTHRG